MRIAILTVGTRGDVQPYIALGQGLKRAGHEVVLVTSKNFRELIESYGLTIAPLQSDAMAMLQSPEGREAIAKGNILLLIRFMMKEVMPQVVPMAEELIGFCEGSDLIVTNILALFVAEAIRDKHGVPIVGGYLQPLLPTRQVASIVAPQLPNWVPLRKYYNYSSGWITLQLGWQLFRPAANKIRQNLLTLPKTRVLNDWSAIRRGDAHVLYGFSKEVVPHPTDAPDSVHTCGYWFVDTPSWEPPADLVKFLEAGPAPVYVGFGSMTEAEPEALTQIVIDALQRSGQRGIIVSGWGGIGKIQIPDTIHVIESAPHDWLFPRMAAAVHHGGSGTTAASLRAGIPTIIVPFFGDQSYFGARVHQLGVGPKAIPRKKLTSDGLAQAIRQAVNYPEMRKNAADLGARIRAEDGVGAAVQLINRVYGAPQ